MTSVGRRRSSLRSIGLLAAAVFAAVPAQAQTERRMLVMPLENVTRDSRILWLGEASAVLLADDLNALGAAAITREERRQAFEALQVPRAASLTDATVIRIAQLVGASEAVVGTLQLEGDLLVAHVRSIALEPGRIVKDVTERGAVGELFQIVERIARSLAPPSHSGEQVVLQNPPAAAFENYIKGLLAETPDTAIAYLQTALKLDPTFDRARFALWENYEDQGEYAQALAAVQGVGDESRWEHHARFLAGISQIDAKKYDEAFATFTALAKVQPAARVFNNLGVIQLRRGVSGQSGHAAFYFSKATELDPAQPDYFFNLGYADWWAKDIQAAIYWLREAVRRDPADGDAHFVLGAALASAGHTAEANREKELAHRLSSVYQEWERRPAADPVPKGLERLKSDIELPHTAGLEETLAAAGQRDQQELARYYLDRARREYDDERDREALLDLKRALFLVPYQAEAHLLVGRVHLRAGQIHEAIDAFKISLWSSESAAARAALAEAYLEAKDIASAEAEADRALALDPSSPAVKAVLEKIHDAR